MWETWDLWHGRGGIDLDFAEEFADLYAGVGGVLWGAQGGADASGVEAKTLECWS